MGITPVITTNNEYAEKNVPFPVFLTVTDNRGNEVPNSSSYWAADGWTKVDFTLVSEIEADPIGTNTASKLTALNDTDSYMSANVNTFTAGDVIVTSVYIGTDTGTKTIYLTSKPSGSWTGYISEALTISTNITRFSVTRTMTDTSNTVIIGGDTLGGKPTAGNFIIWGVQMEKWPLGTHYETDGGAASVTSTATIKEVKLKLLNRGTSVPVSGVAGLFTKRNSPDQSFDIPLGSSVNAEAFASVGETGAGGGTDMFKWFDIRADVQVSDGTDYPQINVDESQSAVLTRGVITNPSVEYSGVKDFTKLENSGLIHV